jgi:hypothetical protein
VKVSPMATTNNKTYEQFRPPPRPIRSPSRRLRGKASATDLLHVKRSRGYLLWSMICNCLIDSWNLEFTIVADLVPSSKLEKRNQHS